MKTHILLGSSEQFCHLCLCQPNSFVFNSHFQPDGFIWLVHHNLTFAGFHVLHNVKFNSYTKTRAKIVVSTENANRFDWFLYAEGIGKE